MNKSTKITRMNKSTKISRMNKSTKISRINKSTKKLKMNKKDERNLLINEIYIKEEVTDDNEDDNSPHTQKNVQLLTDFKQEALSPDNVKEPVFEEEIESKQSFITVFVKEENSEHDSKSWQSDFNKLAESKFPLVVVKKLSNSVLKDYIFKGHKQNVDTSKTRKSSGSSSYALKERAEVSSSGGSSYAVKERAEVSAGSSFYAVKESAEEHGRKELSCYHCRFVFETYDELISHLESACPVNDQSNFKIKIFECAKCGFECRNKRGFKVHLSSHPKKKLFKCSKCCYENTRKKLIKQHVLTHSDIKLFNCSECSFGCNKKHDLKMHMFRHRIYQQRLGKGLCL